MSITTPTGYVVRPRRAREADSAEWAGLFRNVMISVESAGPEIVALIKRRSAIDYYPAKVLISEVLGLRTGVWPTDEAIVIPHSAATIRHAQDLRMKWCIWSLEGRSEHFIAELRRELLPIPEVEDSTFVVEVEGAERCPKLAVPMSLTIAPEVLAELQRFRQEFYCIGRYEHQSTRRLPGVRQSTVDALEARFTMFMVRYGFSYTKERVCKLSAKGRAKELARLGKHLKNGLVTAHEYARAVTAMAN